MLNIPDLNKLKVFYAVYQVRSLVKAAESLHITRSAVSQSLKFLEAELGTRLFIRDSKKILATEPADLLFRAIEPLLNDLQSAVREIETGRKDPVGHLRIGAPQDFGSMHLTEAIVQFRKKHPHITFECVLATPVTLLKQLADGKLDLAFIDNGDIHAKNFPVSIVTVKKERFVLVGAKAYCEKHLGRGTPRYEELRELDFVDYFTYAPVAKMWIKNHFAKAAPELSVSFAAESVRAVIRAIEGGLGVGVVPEHMIEKELKAGRIKLISVGGREFINKISLARRLERPVSAREKEFVEFYKSFALKEG